MDRFMELAELAVDIIRVCAEFVSEPAERAVRDRSRRPVHPQLVENL